MSGFDLPKDGAQRAAFENIIFESIALRTDVRATYIALATAKANFRTEMQTLSAKTCDNIQRSHELLDRVSFAG